MPTRTPLDELMYYSKIGENGTSTDWQPIGRVQDLADLLVRHHDRISEELLGYLREDVRATNEAYMRRHHTIKKVIFSGPATIVIWMDGTKTIVKCMEGDIYDPEKALMMCIMERLLGGSKMEVKRFFKKWIPEEDVEVELNFDLERSVKTIVEGAKKVLENSLGGE